MATATKRQTQEAERTDEQGTQSAHSPSKTASPNSQHTRQSLPPVRTHIGQQAGLKNLNAEQLARGLGWFSIGLGLAELLAPRGIAKISGVKGNTGLIRLFGLREIASGIGIFMQQSKGQRPAAAVWSRVAGDALDLAALGAAFASPKSHKGRVTFATANVLAVTALDVLCAQQVSSNNSTTGGGTDVKKSIIINSSPEELYGFWRDLRNLPRIMHQLKSVQETGGNRSRWVANAPAGSTVEWEAEIVEEREGEIISWRSVEGSEVETYGSVEFARAPGGRGTIVKVELNYEPPGGIIGKGIAKLFGDDPEQQVYEALRCFKQVIETGEVILSDGTVWDNGLLTQRPAQPVSGEELRQSHATGAD
jgi:uncharacterized membrane protein